MGKRFLFVFLDGVGVGAADSARNPFEKAGSPFFPRGLPLGGRAPLPRGGHAVAIDACLGVAGVPQSATGQSALFTGVNTPAHLGYHLFAFPNRPLRAVLAKQNLLKDAKAMGARAAFLNAYPGYSDLLSDRARVRLEDDGAVFAEGVPMELLRRFSVTTIMALSLRQPFFGIPELREERCVYQEYTNASLRGRGEDVPLWDEERAGAVLANASRGWDVGLWEYFRTDLVGHESDPAKAEALVRRIDALLESLLSNLDLAETTLVISSDHGNLEDTVEKGHTQNPVPLLAWGPDAPRLVERCRAITDVTPGILEALGAGPGAPEAGA
ncbi:MAG: alkaline phosphatase family protein [Spirochaetes bacterium]|nr:alkaline phosphatase family protein [Spirochaetota bacterium]